MLSWLGGESDVEELDPVVISGDDAVAAGLIAKVDTKEVAPAAPESSKSSNETATKGGPKWRRPKGTGQLPPVRGGHAATASCDGKAMVLFGGADRVPTPYNVSLAGEVGTGIGGFRDCFSSLGSSE